MVFDNAYTSTHATMTFSLTQSEDLRARTASFLQKDEILDQISRWTVGRILRLKNIVYDDGKFLKQELPYLLPGDLDRLASDLMDLSLAYGILWVDTNIMGFNEIAVAKTAHNTTNIDADVIGAIVRASKRDLQAFREEDGA